MATSLSIPISDTSGCVIFRRLSIATVSGQPWEDFQLNHLVFAFLVAARFADPIRFTPTVSIRQGHVHGKWVPGDLKSRSGRTALSGYASYADLLREAASLILRTAVLKYLADPLPWQAQK
jgi:hypothetical protein